MPSDRRAATRLPKVGDTINLAEAFRSHDEGTKVVISQCFCFGAEVITVWAAEILLPGSRKPFLRLVGHKGDTPADLFRQLAEIYEQGEVAVKEHADEH